VYHSGERPGRRRITPLARAVAIGEADGVLYACALSIELHIPEAASLKAKRAVVKHLVEAGRSRFGVAAAEVGHQDQWQHGELGFAAVAESAGHVEEVLDAVERFVWSHPEVTVIATGRSWTEPMD
jgi:uncharacterized protein YlxP (DUF503 family)